MLLAEHISFAYNGREALHDLSFSVKKGMFLGIIGPNGAGKSTLLKVLMGLLQPGQGRVLLQGKTVHSYASKELALLRAYVPQSLNIPFTFQVKQIVEMGRYARMKHIFHLDAESVAIVDKALRQLDLWNLRNRNFSQLSGGEQQRTLIASALAQQSALIFLDEPTSSLDLNHQQRIFRNIKRLVREEQKTTVLVTHDINLAAQFCDYLILLSDGRMVARGKPDQVLQFDLIQQVYGVKVYIDINPFTKSIYLLPYEANQNDT